MSKMQTIYNLTIDNFDRKNFTKSVYNDNIYIYKDLSLNMSICRYISIYYLIDMLKTQKIYVSNRLSMNDKREQGIKEDFSAMLPLTFMCRNKKKAEADANKVFRLHELAYSTCISCWTKNVEESILFWHCYGQTTCMMLTNLQDLLESIVFTPYTIVIAPIQYIERERTELVHEKIFTKHVSYKDEQEIRMCILSCDHHVMLKVDCAKLIHTLTVNPFFSKSYQQFLKETIEYKYTYLRGKIQYSHLLEYK